MQRKVVFAEGEYYHLYNRGVDKRKIFLDEHDHRRFIKLLYLANGNSPFVFRDVEDNPLADIDRNTPLVAIGAYVLMPNHFHILVKEIIPGGISSFMEKLLTGYSTYFNKRHERTGTLFQGTYQARHLFQNEYLKYIFAYIHLNPVKLIQSDWRESGLKNKTLAKNFVEKYQYSSYPEYTGVRREEGLILSKNDFPDYFSEPHAFKEFLEEWITYKDDVEPNT